MGKSKTSQADTDNGASALMAAMMVANPVTAKAWTDVMAECSQFVMDRLHQDMETQKAMMTCKSPVELVQLQTEFYQQAVQQYSEEAKRLFEMMSSATENTIKEARTGHSRKYDDVPL